MSGQNHQPPRERSQFGLLATRRFAPFFFTQLAGAFNDNLFKNALVLLVAFSGAYASGAGRDVLINLAAGLFVLPFFLFSATAGEIADKYEKSRLIRWVKLGEILIMAAGAAALLMGQTVGLLVVLFLMGAQSAVFGPVKYAIIPQHLRDDELVGGNAQVETGTFVAIIGGTIAAGLLFTTGAPLRWVSIAVVAVAVVGYLCSRWIPEAPANQPQLRVDWNPLRATWRNLRGASGERSVFYSILGISWFWFLGAIYLTQLPRFSNEVVHGSETVVTLLLATFSIGIALGSLLCERLSGHKVELGLVPFGSIGLSLFGIDLYFSVPQAPATTAVGALAFLATPGNWRMLADLLMLGVFGGFYIVPLYATVQKRSDPAMRARVISANNILNALFMVLAAVSGILLLGVAGLSIPQLFLVLALVNIAVAVFIYQQIPEFSMRFLIWLLSHTMYRVTHRDLHKIPDEGAAVLVCNHVSYVDALILAGACRRPIRFVMFKPIYDLPVLNFIFRTAKAIPITSRNSDPESYERAFDQIDAALEAGELICIFPEGQLTTTGELGEFKRGVERIVERRPVPVVPLALRGLWGSFFSHSGGTALRKWPRRFWSRIEVVAGDGVPAMEVSVGLLFERVSALRGALT